MTEMYRSMGSKQSGSATLSPAPNIVPPLRPSTGSSRGGERVIITGNDFVKGCTVTFGGDDADVQKVTSNEIICLTPPHAAGKVPVLVINPDGKASNKGNFEYV